MFFTASLLGAQHNRDSVENKPARLLVVSFGKTFHGMPPFSRGRQVVGPSSLPVVVVQSSAVTSSFGAPVQTSIMGPHFLVQNVQLGYFLQYRNHCVSLGFFDDSLV